MGSILKSWKEIADYLGLGVRTAERWELLNGLPVHRPPNAARGSVFALVEELDDWLERAPVRVKTVSRGAARRPKSPQSRTILTVDDDEGHLYLLCRALSLAGFGVLGAANASDAIEKAVKHIPNAVLLDINLPDRNGFDICKQLRAELRTSKVPIILYTAMDDSIELRRQAKSVGGTAFLAYPMQQQALIAMIKASLAADSFPSQSDRFNFDPTSRLR